jgi:hypothetical protein
MIDRSQLPPGFLMALADSFEEHGRSMLRAALKREPETFRGLAENYLGEQEGARFCRRRRYTDEDLDWLSDRVVAGLRYGTPAEGKPVAKRLH